MQFSLWTLSYVQLKEREKQLVKTQEEAKNYQAKYHLAESKRWAAASYIHVLEFEMHDKRQEMKAGKYNSEEKCKIQDHLVQKNNDVRKTNILDCMNTKDCFMV